MTLTVRECSIDGCSDPVRNRGWCSKHYQRWAKHGTPDYDQAAALAQAAPTRFWSKVDKSSDGCWQWQGTMNDSGYGLIYAEGFRWRAHRYSWKLTHGDIPDGMQIDHLCRNRACVNPAHLRLASPKQNSEHTDSRAGALSSFRGVSFNSRRGKWIAQAHHQGRNHSGGYFLTEEEAAEAARSLRNRLYTHNALDRRQDAPAK